MIDIGFDYKSCGADAGVGKPGRRRRGRRRLGWCRGRRKEVKGGGRQSRTKEEGAGGMKHRAGKGGT